MKNRSLEIKALILTRGYKSQDELARKIKIHAPKLSHIVNGHVQPTPAEFKKLARSLGEDELRSLL